MPDELLIAQLRVGERLAGFPVQVADATPHTTRDGRPFTRYVLRDKSAQINAIYFDHAMEENEAGKVAKVSGTVDEYRGAAQLKLTGIELVAKPSEELLARLQSDIGKDRRTYLMAVLKRTKESLPEVFWRVFELALGSDPLDPESEFWTYAAAQSKHHAERGGLAWHVLTMLSHVDTLAPSYPGLDVDLLKLAVLTHDIGKIDCYEMSAAGARQLSLDRQVGHTTYSMARVLGAIDMLREEGYEISPEDEENLMHCIASHHGKLEWGAVREPETVEAHALHGLDMLDSQLRGGLDNRTAPLPDRGGKPAPAATSPAAEPVPTDPFTVDNDDPFDDEETPAGDSQPTLF